MTGIFKSSIMTYLKKTHWNTKQCPAGSKVSVSVCIDFKLISLPYLPKVNPPVPPLAKHFPISFVFLPKQVCTVPPPGMD